MPLQHSLHEMYESESLFNEGLLSFDFPLHHATDAELEAFLGNLVSKASRSVAKAASGVAKTAGGVFNTIQKVVPASALTYGWGFTPMGLAMRAGLGAVTSAASGKNVFHGAARMMAGDPVSKFYVDTAFNTARGQNIFKAAKDAVKAAGGDVRESLRFAAMVAPFVPGVGTGVGAALGAANALAAGEPITAAVLAAAKGAVPGGVLAQAGFTMALNVAKGKTIAAAALETLRSRLPGGPAAQAAFDTGLALAKGQSIQTAALATAGRLLPRSPYSADALSFARRVMNGENIQRAALSTAGKMVMQRIEQKVGPITGKPPLK